jgi:uncharacterized membrane protein
MFDPITIDWLSLLLRWAHVMAGIAWIGTSFYFIWLDASLRDRGRKAEGVAGETWMVHGGGFYRAEKYGVAPAALPEELHWFKYEAYATWLSGMLLLAVIYYWSAEAFLVDPSVADLSPAIAIALSLASLAVGWLAYDLLCRSPLGERTGLLAACVFVLVVAAAVAYEQVFSGRAAFLHVGVLVGTIMVGNVFFVIIPNQKKTVAALLAGRSPDPKPGAQAKQRSLHNNYLTLPVIVMMVSNHYPLLYAEGRGPIMVAGIVVIGGLIRHFFNLRHGGHKDWSRPFLIPGAAAVVIALLLISRPDPGDDQADGAAPSFAEVEVVIRQRCMSCHASRPTDESFDAPPAGLAFDKEGAIRANAQRIYAQTVLSDAMPLGNVTEITAEERQLIGRWVRAGAR